MFSILFCISLLMTKLSSTEQSCFDTPQNSIYTCTSNGRFKDGADTTCSKYYECTKYGVSYIITHLECPVGEYFHPDKQVCHKEYFCEVSTEITPTIHFPTSTLFDNKATNQATEIVTPISTTRSASCETNKQSIFFDCTEKGRYPNLNDSTCQTYFLCNLLKNGTFIKTQYNCPIGSYFNPDIHLCDISYKCSCYVDVTKIYSTVSSTSSISSESSNSDFNYSLNNVSDSSKTTTPVYIDKTTFKEIVSTQVEQCVSYSNFECNQKGRYPNLNDTTCQTYYLCNLLKNGSFIKTRYTCPVASYFNPDIDLCDVSYICPCYNDVTEIPSIDITAVSFDDHSLDEVSYVTNAITPIPVSTTPFEVISTEVELCISNSSATHFQCSAKGRYPNLNDSTCQTYFLCNLLKNGTFIKTQYNCPIGSYFNPNTHLCDTSYQCPCYYEVTEIPFTETTSHTIQDTSFSDYYSSKSTSYMTNSTTSTYVNTTPNEVTSTEVNLCNNSTSRFDCSEKGRFPNLNDTTCQTYFLCSLLKNGTFIKTQYNCPIGSYFNSNTHVCDTSYQCPCYYEVTETSTTISSENSSSDNDHSSDINSDSSITITPFLSTTSTTVTEAELCITDNYFECSEKGRFPNLNDTSCQTYFLCNLLKSGKFLKTQYSCPKDSFFNPNMRLCDVSYKCPCNIAIT